MAEIPGSVRVTGFMAPSDSEDTYPVHDSIYGKGGWREVADVAARNAIPAQRRREGMCVYVTATSQAWWLQGGIADGNWTLMPIGESAGLQREITFVLRKDLIVGESVTNAVAVAKAGTIESARAVATTAPVGADAIFKLKKNGVEITTAENRLTIADSETTGSVGAFSLTDVAVDDSFTLDISQVGSTTPGAWVIIVLTIRNDG